MPVLIRFDRASHPWTDILDESEDSILGSNAEYWYWIFAHILCIWSTGPVPTALGVFG